MDPLFALFAVLVALVGTLARIAIRPVRGPTAMSVAMLLVALSLPVGYLALAELLGRPRPLALEWRDLLDTETQVLAAAFDEPRNIYVWIQVPDSKAPRFYSLPWREQAARELFEAMASAESSGAEVIMDMRTTALESELEPTFHAAPVMALPVKHIR